MPKFFVLALTVICFFSCKKDNSSDLQLIEDKAKIRQYLTEHSLVADSLDTGLYYIIEEAGTGTIHPEPQSTVVVLYQGYLLDGTVFDQTNTNALTIPLGYVIKGWQQGIPLFKKGGKGKLFVPSSLGYGPDQVGSIPPNSVLIFDINLVNFY